MSDICLIFTPIHEMEVERIEAPMGLLYLATYLNQNGFDAEVVDLSGYQLKDVTLPYAEWYGFVTYSTTYHRTLKVKEMALKVNPKAKTIAGGPHASALPKEVVKDFDYVILDEGESALLSLLRGEVSKQPVVDFTPNQARSLISLPTINEEPHILQGDPIWDLDSIPFPDYELVEIETYKRIVDGKKSLSILSSRGCPFKCKFCNSKIMGGGTRLRYRSPTNVVSEMVSLRDKYDIHAFRFQDDIFGLDRKWLQNFTEAVKPMDIRYRSFVRVHQCALSGFAETLYEGGCRHVALGIESGSDKILQAMVKGQTAETGRAGIARAKEAGLTVRCYFIVGYPGETWDTVHETLQFVKDTRPHEFAVYPFIPYPGTALYYEPEKHGIFNMSDDFTKFFQIYGDKKSHFVYDLEEYDRYELQKMKDYLVGELEEMGMAWYHEAKGYHTKETDTRAALKNIAYDHAGGSGE